MSKYYYMEPNHIERFLSKIDKSAPNGCWNWTAGIDSNGYGNFSVLVDKVQHNYKTNRYAYRYFVGPIWNDLFVLHKCDNKRCVNPDHLYLGDHTQNMRDCVERGLAPKGEKHVRFIRTEGLVDRIKDLRKFGYSLKKIADWLSISIDTVRTVVRQPSNA